MQDAALPQHILIVEDQPDALRLMQDMVERLFNTRSYLAAKTLKQADGHVNTRYDLVLCDLSLPDGLSIEWLRRYRQQHPSAWLVVSTLFDDNELVFSSLRAGADGYLLKTDPPALLDSTLKRLLTGEPPMSPSIARKVMLHFRQQEQSNHIQGVPTTAFDWQDRLTPREVEVLGLIAQGLSAKAVGAQLNTSHHTVNDQVKSIYSKLGIGSRSEAATEAMRRGLIKLPPR